MKTAPYALHWFSILCFFLCLPQLIFYCFCSKPFAQAMQGGVKVAWGLSKANCSSYEASTTSTRAKAAAAADHLHPHRQQRKSFRQDHLSLNSQAPIVLPVIMDPCMILHEE
jgi:hypothetical protein